MVKLGSKTAAKKPADVTCTKSSSFDFYVPITVDTTAKVSRHRPGPHARTPAPRRHTDTHHPAAPAPRPTGQLPPVARAGPRP